MSLSQDDQNILDVLCPMHVIIDMSGHITHVGPTLQKLRPDTPLAGQRFLELFELRRPLNVRRMEELRASSGMKLQLMFRAAPNTAFKGVLMPLADEAGLVVNLSFGKSLAEAVSDYSLTVADFAATDLTVEMLYLMEANSAAMAISRGLNVRLESARIAAEEQAYTDTLTGLKNRRAMDHVLARLIAEARPFALMHIDLDFFKAVNDTMGHAAGDHVLQKVARIMVEETRSDDTVARVGGDEFVLVFDGLLDEARLEAVARRIISKLETPIPFGDELCHISASGGTVLSSDYEPPEAAEMLADADRALYASKHRGRACHTFFTSAMRDDPALMSAPPSGRDGAASAGPGPGDTRH